MCVSRRGVYTDGGVRRGAVLMIPSIPPELEVDLEHLEDDLRRSRARLLCMLLGPGKTSEHLALRRRTAAALTAAGYRSFLMEDQVDIPGEDPIDKWGRIRRERHPDHYLVIVPRDVGSLGGVEWELAKVHEVHPIDFDRRVSFLLEDGLQGSQVFDGYTGATLNRTWFAFYHDEPQLVRRAARRLDNLVLP